MAVYPLSMDVEERITLSIDPAPLTYIIVITFNGKHHLERCLPSLLNTDYSNFQIVLLDNASTDNTSEYVRRAYPNVRILRNPHNYGFAKGNNVAMAVALEDGAQYVLLLNDDTVILDPDWLNQAIVVAEKGPDIGMVGFDITADLQKSCSSNVEVKEVDRIPGCALLIRCELLHHLGLFDEVYFAYGEESDLEARAIKAGYRLLEINSPLYHRGAGSFSRMPIRFAFLFMRNWIRFSIKNESWAKMLVRPFIVFDLLCSPFPIRNRVSDTVARKKLGKNPRTVNFLLLCGAILWNLIFLPQTLMRRYHDHRRVVDAKSALEDQMRRSYNASPTTIKDHTALNDPTRTNKSKQ